MSAKHFCDACAREMNRKQDFLISVEMQISRHDRLSPIPASVTFSVGGYDVCRYCLIDAVKRLDDRPKVAT